MVYTYTITKKLYIHEEVFIENFLNEIIENYEEIQDYDENYIDVVLNKDNGFEKMKSYIEEALDDYIDYYFDYISLPDKNYNEILEQITEEILKNRSVQLPLDI